MADTQDDITTEKKTPETDESSMIKTDPSGTGISGDEAIPSTDTCYTEAIPNESVQQGNLDIQNDTIYSAMICHVQWFSLKVLA